MFGADGLDGAGAAGAAGAAGSPGLGAAGAGDVLEGAFVGVFDGEGSGAATTGGGSAARCAASHRARISGLISRAAGEPGAA
ncbi:MAG: hypothetical protein ACRDKW_02420, partial [Actinomycetota bacterium]